jgi:hypothetical protein
MRALNHGAERPETKTAFTGFFRERAEKLAPERCLDEQPRLRDA